MAKPNTARRIFRFRSPGHLQYVLGEANQNIQPFLDSGVRFHIHAKTLKIISGEDRFVREASQRISAWKEDVETGGTLVRRRQKDTGHVMSSNRRSPIVEIKPKNESQAEYLDILRSHDLVFGLSSPGTGRTLLAVAVAIEALQAEQVSRIVLTRPAVEAAGEKLGFLPGSLESKIDPYLQPIYDALQVCFGNKQLVEVMRKNGQIEVAPLAFMRGRTLSDCYIILDEAQNCSYDQLKMLLTRIGENAKCVVTGDIDQSDLGYERSGLQPMVDALEYVEGVGVFEFDPTDVVRHPLVARIVSALETFERHK